MMNTGIRGWITLTFITASAIIHADVLREERAKMQEEFEMFRKQAIEEYESFREQINMEFAEALRDPWQNIKLDPIVIKEKDPEPEPPIWDENDENMDLSPSPIKIKETVIPPKPQPQPEPVEPINPVVTPDPVISNSVFYGTHIKYRNHEWSSLPVNSIDEDGIANSWKWLTNKEGDAFITDMLNIRKDLKLPDWGYFKLIDQIIGKDFGRNTNKHTIVMAYVLSQSGYKVRLARKDNELSMYFSSQGTFYDRPCLTIDGERFWQYSDKNSSDRVYISNVKFPGEQIMSLAIPNVPVFAYKAGNPRDVTVHNFSDIHLSVTVNQNLVDFYNDYPTASLDTSPYSIWSNIARTPASKEIKTQIYDKLKPMVYGKSQKESVNFLLKVAQSFPYGYDNEIWGDDRAFWVEESWHYPLSDCEDHAINFVKLVNAVLGLKTAVVYYPGHLYSAIAVTDGTLTGDYIMHNGSKYIVCDPTYFYAPAGLTAPDMNNSEAILIPIE